MYSRWNGMFEGSEVESYRKSLNPSGYGWGSGGIERG